MKLRSWTTVALWLGIAAATGLMAGCGGGSSSMPVAQSVTSSSTTALASGGRLVASGSKGVTFTFVLGAGVPAGETATVSAMPSPPPCVMPACTLVERLDGFEFSVGPQPLSAGVLTSVGLTGVPSPFDVSMILADTVDLSAFTNFFLLPPTGGALSFGDQASVHPVQTLAPNRTYTIAIFPTTIPPS